MVVLLKIQYLLDPMSKLKLISERCERIKNVYCTPSLAMTMSRSVGRVNIFNCSHGSVSNG